METIEAISGILGIIMLVFGILQIILFFKIWGMTNDVRKIKERTFLSFSQEDIIKEIYKKNPNIENILFEALYNEMKYAYDEDMESFSFVLKEYNPLYEKAGIEMPEIFTNIHSRADWKNTFKFDRIK